MTNFIVTNRKTDYLLPPSLEDWLNEDHLARFVVEVVDQLDISNLTRQYAGRGSTCKRQLNRVPDKLKCYWLRVFAANFVTKGLTQWVKQNARHC
jgi:hypothetical protein